MTPPNDQYFKPIAERARELQQDYASAPVAWDYHLSQLFQLVAELAEKLEPAEVRKK